jgi:hypothetical protein
MALGNPIPTPAETQAATGSRTKKVMAAAIGALLVCAIVAVAMVGANTETQELAAKAAKAAATAKSLTYGSTITLMNPYNLYILVQKNGEINMGGFLNGNNNVKIVSPEGKKGAVKYGDEVSLMGDNGKYFLVRYSGKITSRASVIARDTKFKIIGGSGEVHLADRISFKSEFGYLRCSDDGTRSVEHLTAAEKFLIGLPGQETGLKQANGLHYGEVVVFENMAAQYMQCDHNGWITIRAKPQGNWDHFTILSATHAEGIITYGNKIVLRAHNGRMVSTRLDNNALEAVSLAISDRSEFTLLGATGTASGVVHDRDRVALRTFQGYVEAEDGSARVFMGRSGHYTPSSIFLIHKIWDSTL